jgi:hypothetical protein
MADTVAAVPGYPPAPMIGMWATPSTVDNRLIMGQMCYGRVSVRACVVVLTPMLEP